MSGLLLYELTGAAPPLPLRKAGSTSAPTEAVAAAAARRLSIVSELGLEDSAFSLGAAATSNGGPPGEAEEGAVPSEELEGLVSRAAARHAIFRRSPGAQAHPRLPCFALLLHTRPSPVAPANP